MKYEAKSILVGRKKKYDDDPDVRPCFISLFKENDPHKTGEVPFEILEFDKMHRVNLEGFNIKYLLPGNDIVVNDLEYIEINVDEPHLDVTGKQKK